MEGKPKFNFSQFSLSKPSKGHWIKNSIYFAVILLLITLIYWLLTKQVRKSNLRSQQIELIEHFKIEIDSTNP